MRKSTWTTPSLTVLNSGGEAQDGGVGAGGTAKVANPSEKIPGNSNNPVGDEGETEVEGGS